MTVDPDRPVALITGGGSGIGSAIAQRLARDHQVVVCGRRAAPLEAIAAQTGGMAVVVDLCDPIGPAGLVSQVIARFGRLDALILNAGVVLPAPVAAMSLADWQTQMTVNLTSPFLLAQAALPYLLKRQGKIVAIASAAAHATGSGLSAYSASKAGLIQLVETIAFENARFGLRANSISPGWVRTEMGDVEMAELGGSAEEGYARVTAQIPQRRAATPAEIANVAAFLLSDDASFMNGATVPVDGGSGVVDVGMLAFDQP